MNIRAIDLNYCEMFIYLWDTNFQNNQLPVRRRIERIVRCSSYRHRSGDIAESRSCTRPTCRRICARSDKLPNRLPLSRCKWALRPGRGSFCWVPSRTPMAARKCCLEKNLININFRKFYIFLSEEFGKLQQFSILKEHFSHILRKYLSFFQKYRKTLGSANHLKYFHH